MRFEPARSARLTAMPLVALTLTATAGAQESRPLWPDLTLSAAAAAAAQDSMLKGKIGEAPSGGQGVEPARDVFQVKTVEVRPGELREEQPVGDYDQPKWTTFRRFPSTRVYLQTPPGGAQFEQWFELRKKKSRRGDDETRLRQELEFGLGHRMQLDLYMREEHVRNGVNSTYEWAGYSAELRYALGDWGEICGNPTLYFEWVFNDGEPDKIEPKLLLGGELARGWHWGTNLIHERTLAGRPDRTEEWAAAASVSRTIVDEGFSAGVTSTYSYESEPGAPKREYTREWLLGPSFQLVPHPRAAIDIEPLFGLTGESKRLKLFIVFSWHF